MRIDRAGLPFILGALLPAIAFAVAGYMVLATTFLLLSLGFVLFFRDPERRILASENEVVSPADGRILVAGHHKGSYAPSGEWLQVSVFLSPLDVHINRAPVSGRVMGVEHQAGRFFSAYRNDAAVSNERTEIWIDHKGQTVVCRQIVGFLARRIVCRIKSGDDLCTGDRIGLMKFGSRMDVFLPVTADLQVKAGQLVRGGETVIATLSSTTRTAVNVKV